MAKKRRGKGKKKEKGTALQTQARGGRERAAGQESPLKSCLVLLIKGSETRGHLATLDAPPGASN